MLSALALVLVIEGIVPFLSPSLWRRMATTMLGKADKTVRICGFVSMMAGVALLSLAHSGMIF